MQPAIDALAHCRSRSIATSSKRYGAVEAVRGIELDVGDGEIVEADGLALGERVTQRQRGEQRRQVVRSAGARPSPAAAISTASEMTAAVDG